MREILFRGKTTLDNEWVIGAGVYKSEGQTWIITDDVTKTENRGTGSDAINPETVGQYTGLKDKKGRKIFEGDIVVVYARGYHTVCTVSWAETVAHFQLWQINTIPKTSTNLNLGNYDCEVIGNIHDNPELLKGGEGDG